MCPEPTSPVRSRHFRLPATPFAKSGRSYEGQGPARRIGAKGGGLSAVVHDPALATSYTPSIIGPNQGRGGQQCGTKRNRFLGAGSGTLRVCPAAPSSWRKPIRRWQVRVPNTSRRPTSCRPWPSPPRSSWNVCKKSPTRQSLLKRGRHRSSSVHPTRAPLPRPHLEGLAPLGCALSGSK